MSIASITEAIFAHLARLDRPVVKRRRPGLSADDIEIQLLSLGLAPLPDLVAFYAHCDGTEVNEGDILDDFHFFPGYYWMNFAEALAECAALRAFEPWQPSWLPVFTNGGGDFYSVCCDANAPDFGAVVFYMLGQGEQSLEYHDLSTMMTALEHAFAEGAIYVENRFLEMDGGRLREIARQLQPGLDPHAA